MFSLLLVRQVLSDVLQSDPPWPKPGRSIIIIVVSIRSDSLVYCGTLQTLQSSDVEIVRAFFF